MFAALGDATRLQLMYQLSTSGPGSIAQLSSVSVLSRQAITKHLKVLADAGYVKGVRRGREHVWQMQPERLDKVRDHLDQISLAWDNALDRLKQLVES
jgi:DNA-binding transcriptional ArsR family regulator